MGAAGGTVLIVAGMVIIAQMFSLTTLAVLAPDTSAVLVSGVAAAPTLLVSVLAMIKSGRAEQAVDGLKQEQQKAGPG